VAVALLSACEKLSSFDEVKQQFHNHRADFELLKSALDKRDKPLTVWQSGETDPRNILTDGEAKQYLALMQKADVCRADVFNGKDGGHEFSFTVSAVGVVSRGNSRNVEYLPSSVAVYKKKAPDLILDDSGWVMTGN
jgi:hypothetical protein